MKAQKVTHKKKKMGDNLFPTNFHYGVVSLAMELLINVDHIFPSYRKQYSYF